MPSKQSTQSFLKRYDRFAKNVTLTYKKSGSFETSCGGIASIITFLMLAYWLAVNLFFTIFNYGTFTTSSQTSLTQDIDGSYPLYELKSFDLFIAYKFISLNISQPIDDQEIDKYISAVYIQLTSDGTMTVYNST